MIEPTDVIDNIILYNADCMEVMKQFKDNEFDLAIVDPPFGINIAKKSKFGKAYYQKYKIKDWDSSTPDINYFNELLRISKNQIIWGGNYFTDKLPISRGWIFWDKGVPSNFNYTFSQGDLAWTSFNYPIKKVKTNKKYNFNCISNNARIALANQKIHPTQKPIQLYEWLLLNYAKKGERILDTHFGSLSIGIACYNLRFELTAIELDEDYYQMAKQRLLDFKKQLTIKILNL